MTESIFFLVWVSFVTASDLHMILVTAAFPVLVIFMHRSNIKRLINGTESKTNLFKKGNAQ
jgi:glycerol-3-phosphate acyltransferase PlsY